MAIKPIIDLSGKKILVTGASSGIGRQTCITLAEVGATVILVARNEERLQETLSCMTGEGHKIYTFDVSEIDAIADFVKSVVAEVGPLDGFAHCAGISPSRPFGTCTYERMLAVMQTNFFSYSEFVRILTKKGNCSDSFSIVGISSVSAVRGNPATIPYSASKAAMDALTRALAKEFGGRGVRINTVVPSMIDTPMGTGSGKGNDDFWTNLYKKQFLGLGEPVDVANLIAYLLSDAAKFITGTHVSVDGGYLL